MAKKGTSGWWEKKADVAWSLQVRTVGECAICGRAGKLDAHHLIGRKRYRYRYHLDNGICLCPGHHTFANAGDGICAHGNFLEVSRFARWMRLNRSEQYEWFVEHEFDRRPYIKRDPDFLTREEAFVKLTETQDLRG